MYDKVKLKLVQFFMQVNACNFIVLTNYEEKGRAKARTELGLFL